MYFLSPVCEKWLLNLQCGDSTTQRQHMANAAFVTVFCFIIIWKTFELTRVCLLVLCHTSWTLKNNNAESNSDNEDMWHQALTNTSIDSVYQQQMVCFMEMGRVYSSSNGFDTRYHECLAAPPCYGKTWLTACFSNMHLVGDSNAIKNVCN